MKPWLRMVMPFLALFWTSPRLMAQPTLRVDKAYEDTVRILVISNDSARGNCNLTSGVGIKTRDFVLASLAGVPNVRYRESKTTQWSDVLALWPGKLPHAIVHVNAGWTTESGNYLDLILNTAADSGVGVVSIGDDAAGLAQRTFGMLNVENTPQPMGDATQYVNANTSLWLDLDGKADTVGGGGIVRNTTDILGVTRVYFHPVEPNSGADSTQSYRCQADADKYTTDTAFARNLTFLGFQRAFDGNDTIAAPRELQTIIAFQNNIRRGVALSYQPQFLANPQAAHQIDYDAIMYASGAKLYRNPSLTFTDSLGRDLGPGDVWSPARGRLYLNFQDDFIRADLAKQITLTIANGAGAAGDLEVVTVGSAVEILGGKGRWRVEIALAENPARPSNGIVEVTLPTVITAKAPAHDEAGLPDGDTVTATLRMNATVIPAPTVTLTVSPTSVTEGSGSTLTWSSTEAASCTASGAWTGAKAISGSQSSGALTTTSNFTLTCTGPGGSVSRSASVTVTAKPPPPPPPPLVDTILSAYMRDLDGNGAADQAVFHFIRPLDSLPATVAPVYWNDALPTLANSRPPVLTFAPGSNQTVLLAGFSGAEFPMGLTSVPPGGNPHAVFPAGGVFAGQKPVLADSMGPVLISASIALGSTGAETVADTLFVTLSEPLRAGFTTLLRFGRPNSSACNVLGASSPVLPAVPLVSTPDGLRYTVVLDATAPYPVSGDCAYLEGNGSVLDLPGNKPSSLGIPITGPKAVRGIRLLAGHPAVSAEDNNKTAGSKPLDWIPPVGYIPGNSFVELQMPDPAQLPTGTDPFTTTQPLPADLALVRIVSTGRYIAHVAIFDNLGNPVKNFQQSFGYKGELENKARREPLGYQSFLIWDRKDVHGRRAGQGAYIWRIEFTLEDNTRARKNLRTGLLR